MRSFWLSLACLLVACVQTNPADSGDLLPDEEQAGAAGASDEEGGASGISGQTQGGSKQGGNEPGGSTTAGVGGDEQGGSEQGGAGQGGSTTAGQGGAGQGGSTTAGQGGAGQGGSTTAGQGGAGQGGSTTAGQGGAGQGGSTTAGQGGTGQGGSTTAGQGGTGQGGSTTAGQGGAGQGGSTTAGQGGAGQGGSTTAGQGGAGQGGSTTAGQGGAGQGGSEQGGSEQGGGGQGSGCPGVVVDWDWNAGTGPANDILLRSSSAWSVGVATAGPKDGKTWLATNPGGKYASLTNDWVQLPTMDLSAYAACKLRITVKLWRECDTVGMVNYDGGNLQFTTDPAANTKSAWSLLGGSKMNYDGEVLGSCTGPSCLIYKQQSWTSAKNSKDKQAVFEASAPMGSSLTLRFTFFSDNETEYAGIYVGRLWVEAY